MAKSIGRTILWIVTTVIGFWLLWWFGSNLDHIAVRISAWIIGAVMGLWLLYWVGMIILFIFWVAKEFIVHWVQTNKEDLYSESHDEIKADDIFYASITTLLRELCETNPGAEGSDAFGYYLADEGIIRIHQYTDGPQGTSDHDVIEFDASSEEDAELAFDMFVEHEENLLREAELEGLFDCPGIDSDYSYLIAQFFSMTEIDPDEPEWDWGGSYREICQELRDANEGDFLFESEDIKGVWKPGVSDDSNDGYLTIYRLENGKWEKVSDEREIGQELRDGNEGDFLLFEAGNIKGVWKPGVVGDPDDGYIEIYRLENGKWKKLNDEYSTGDISYWETSSVEAEKLFHDIVMMYC